MKHDVKNVVIAGGTGFLGYHTALLFSKMGTKVSTISIHEDISAEQWFPKSIPISYGDLFKMTEDEIVYELQDRDIDTFIYGLGPDDRHTPKAPAYNFFQERLVEHCLKVCKAAKRVGVKRCVIMNSYFAYFDRELKGKLSKNHPYIKSRVEQATAIEGIGKEGEFDVMIVELPYIFGDMPVRIPIWKDVFVERFKKFPFVFFPTGGTAAIHVDGVAEYIVAAAYNGENGKRYPVASTNVKFKDMISFMMATAGFPKKFVKMPALLGYVIGLILILKEILHGQQSGLHMAKLMTNILSRDLYFDPEISRKELKLDELGFEDSTDIWTGIREAMQKCYPDTYQEIEIPK